MLLHNIEVDTNCAFFPSVEGRGETRIFTGRYYVPIIHKNTTLLNFASPTQEQEQ